MRVIPNGPMCSLRAAMLVWLIPLFLVVGGGSSVFSYWTYNRMVGDFMDEQMQQLAEAWTTSQELPTVRQLDARAIFQGGAYITQAWSADGKLQASTASGVLPLRMGTPGFHDVVAEGRRWRVFAAAPSAEGLRLQVLQSGDFRHKLAAERAFAALLPVLILLPLAIAMLWGVAAKLSREVREVGQEAARQDAHSIAELPLARVPSEIVPLVASFNGLLARLREAFSTQRRFVQDAAHELRTPITAVALQLENVRRDMPPGACADSFGQLQDGVTRAQRLVDQLLRLSRNESAGTGLDVPVDVDVRALLRESIVSLITLADRRRIDLGLVDDAQGQAVRVQAHPGDLRSVVDNLIENALRYTSEGGTVDVRLSLRHGLPCIEVVDTGPGVPPELLPRLFDRFFRVPGNGSSGSGLGLAIAQAAAVRNGLRISLSNRADTSGLVACVAPR